MDRKFISKSLFIFLLTMYSLTLASDFIGIGEPAPDFTLMSVEGDTVTLSEVVFDEGKIVLLNFFGWN